MSIGPQRVGLPSEIEPRISPLGPPVGGLGGLEHINTDRQPIGGGGGGGPLSMGTSTVARGVTPGAPSLAPLPDRVKVSVEQFLKANPRGNVFAHLEATFSGEGFFAVNQALLGVNIDGLAGPAQAVFARAQKIATGALSMQADGYGEHFVSRVSLHRLGLYLGGVTDLFPQRCLPRSEADRVAGTLVDEEGHVFDSFRESHTPGRPNLTQAFQDYVGSNGGDYDLIDKWADDQAEGSWSPRATAMKWLTLKEKYPDPSVHEGRFFWGPTGMANVRDRYHQFLASDPDDEAKTIETWAMQRAFMTEIFSSILFPGSTPNGDLVVFRTEDPRVIASSGLQIGAPKDYKKGPFESCSLMSVIQQGGNQTVAFLVPPHRIGGLYCFSRGSSQTGCFFLRDSENEVLVSLEGLPGTYLGEMNESDMTKKMEVFKRQHGVIA